VILQELCRYYQRLREDPESGIAPPGFSPQKISFAVVIEPDGELVDIVDIRDTSDKNPVPMELLVPEAQIRAVNIAANFLWDNSGYVLGFDGKGKAERTIETFKAFLERQKKVAGTCKDEGMNAVISFLKKWNPADATKLANFDDIVDKNLVFRLHGERGYIHQRPAVIVAWKQYQSGNAENDDQIVTATCLVTGKEQEIARLHGKIKGVQGAQSSGASIVSFNLDTFTSYGKEQSYNAPVGKSMSFAYTTALNYLLRYESDQKISIGDTTTVFWAKKPSKVEYLLGQVMASTRDIEAKPEVRDYLEAVRAGLPPQRIDETIEFFILGLSPNASRIAIRFWHAGTVGELDRAIGQHFNDVAIIKEYENQHEFPGIWHFLIETTVNRKSDKINPLLAGSFAKSILTGTAYPSNLLSTLINRIRADHDINYYRMAMIKAILCRNARIHKKEEEVTRMLDEKSINTAYRLGRLFAVLEKAQQDAIQGIKATIKDRFYGSASSTPRIVFPQLLRLSQHHINKLERGKIHFEILTQEILDGIDQFPNHLSLEDQGKFALGYYHQRKALFTKRSTDESIENN
jgi:CRISPR-associated protein Csd1